MALAFLSFKRAIAMFAGVPLLGVLPPEYAEWLAEARRRVPALQHDRTLTGPL